MKFWLSAAFQAASGPIDIGLPVDGIVVGLNNKEDEMSYMAMFILDDPAILDEVLQSLVGGGIRGATIIDRWAGGQPGQP
jgi:hypothetical protein